MLPKPQVIQLLTHATVFVCPSIYEPMGIVNLEAMACETAVVASRVGGIPEVVAEGETGFLVEPGECDGARGRSERATRRSRAGRALRQGGTQARRRALLLARDRRANGRPYRSLAG